MKIQKRRSDRSGRPPLSSPGRPPVAGRDERRRFRAAIAAGMVSDDAAVGAGVPQAVRDAITRTIITLPEQLRRSLAWDQGAELTLHASLKIDAGVQVHFCDPHSP